MCLKLAVNTGRLGFGIAVTTRKPMSQSVQTLLDAVRNGNSEEVQQIVSSSPQIVNEADSRGFTPLIMAAYFNQPALVELFVDAGAQINGQDGSGNTALMGACFKGFEEIVSKLITRGADVNVQNFGGATALTYAVTFGKVNIVKALLDGGADKTLKDNRGKTPVAYAKAEDNKQLLALLEK